MKKGCKSDFPEGKWSRIAKGADGIVYKYCKNGQECRAVKQVVKLSVGDNELKTIYLLQGSNIDKTHIHAAYFSASHCDYCIDDVNRLYSQKGCYWLEQELYDGDLWSLGGRLGKKDTEALIIQIKSGLLNLYKAGVSHNDLHAGNVLYRKLPQAQTWEFDGKSVNSRYHFLIADFSRAKNKPITIPLDEYLEIQSFHIRQFIALHKPNIIPTPETTKSIQKKLSNKNIQKILETLPKDL